MTWWCASVCDKCIMCVSLAGIPDSRVEDASVARALGLSWSPVLKSQEDGGHTLINSAEVCLDTQQHTLLLYTTLPVNQLFSHSTNFFMAINGRPLFMVELSIGK